MSLGYLLILGSLLAADPPPDPTKPSMVTLDFKDRPIQEVATAIGARAGSTVLMQFFNETDPNPRKITLVSPEPVPFWDAIDRFCLETKLTRSLNEGAGLGRNQPNVSIYGAGADPGPALYSGPFRFGRFTLHSNFRRQYSPDPKYADPPPDGYRAEFEVLPEPRVMAIRTGPLEQLEVIDENGHSLLDPKLTDPDKISGPLFNGSLGSYQSIVRVKLATPSSESHQMKLLRGVLPVEAGIAPRTPTLSIVLADSMGKTFTAGDLSITIEEFGARLGGPTTLRLVAKIIGERAPDAKVPKPLTWARSGLIQRTLELVDSEGRVLGTPPSRSVAADDLRVDYTFQNFGPTRPAALPKTLRVFAPAWVRWNVPFEFHDVPLP